MRRCIIVLLALVAVAAFGPARADAKTPCRDRIYNDWYRNGKIASTYPLACYRDALRHIPTDVVGLLEPRRRHPARTAGGDRSQCTGEHVPSRSAAAPAPASPRRAVHPPTPRPPSPADTAPDAADPGDMSTTPTATPIHVVAATPAAAHGGVPLPVIVLGGVALVAGRLRRDRRSASAATGAATRLERARAA